MNESEGKTISEKAKEWVDAWQKEFIHDSDKLDEIVAAVLNKPSRISIVRGHDAPDERIVVECFIIGFGREVIYDGPERTVTRLTLVDGDSGRAYPVRPGMKIEVQPSIVLSDLDDDEWRVVADFTET